MVISTAPNFLTLGSSRTATFWETYNISTVWDQVTYNHSFAAIASALIILALLKGASTLESHTSVCSH